MVFRLIAPVISAFGMPFECPMLKKTPERFIGIAHNVGGKPHLSARLKGIGKFVQKGWLDQASLLLATLWPWVWKQDKTSFECRFAEIWQDKADVIIMQTDVFEIIVRNAGEGLRDAIVKRFSANETDIRVQTAPADEMLGAAKADFQP